MYINNIHLATNYIEENLSENLKLNDIAKISGYSMFHFDRIFKYTVGESVIEYVRKRKLTEAANLLVSTKIRIIDIAIKYGFNSQQAFSLAFKKFYGKTPGEYRKEKHDLVLLGQKRLTFDNIAHLQEGITREPKIITLDRFTVIGLLYYGSNRQGEIPKLWAKFLDRKNEIKYPIAPKVNLGICDFVSDFDPATSEFYYLACTMVKTSSASLPKGMIKRTYPKNVYAVFTHKGSSEDLEDTYRYIYGTYFPKSNLKLAEEADFELYDERFNGNKGSEMEIYIPIKRTNETLHKKQTSC